MLVGGKRGCVEGVALGVEESGAEAVFVYRESWGLG